MAPTEGDAVIAALFTPAAERWFALALLIACGLALFAWTLRQIGTWAAAEVERHVQAALADEAADWCEPTREEVERLMDGDDWARANGYGPPLSDTPIYDQTAAHIARQAAEDIDDEWARICDATGGAA